MASQDPNEHIIRVEHDAVFHPYVTDDGHYVLAPPGTNLAKDHKKPPVRKGMPLLPHLIKGLHLRMHGPVKYTLIMPEHIHVRLDMVLGRLRKIDPLEAEVDRLKGVVQSAWEALKAGQADEARRILADPTARTFKPGRLP